MYTKPRRVHKPRRQGTRAVNVDPKAKLAAGKRLRPGAAMLRPSSGLR